MLPSYKTSILSFVLLLCSVVVLGQDSVYHQWQVQSRKEGDKTELVFKTAPAAGFYIYAPGQSLLDLPAVTISFSDSSLKAGVITAADSRSESKAIGIFDNATFNVHTDPVEWVVPLLADGPLPAKVQG